MPKIIKLGDYFSPDEGFLPELITFLPATNPNTTVTINGFPIVVIGASVTPHRTPTTPPVEHLDSIVLAGPVQSRVTVNNIPIAIQTDYIKGITSEECNLPVSLFTQIAGTISTVFAGPGI